MDPYIISIFLFIIGLIIGYLIPKKSSDSNIKELEINNLKTQNVQLNKAISDQNQEILTLQIEKARLEEQVAQLGKSQEELKSNITDLGEKYKIEFKNLANELLEAKSKNLEEVSNKNIKTLLDPLSISIKDFKEKVEKVYGDEAKERHSLEKQVEKLVQTTTTVSQQAENLANALKGNVKQQGNWGEMILSSILENSGLTKNREYFLQEFIRDKSGEIIKDSNGNTLQPDVTIIYPDQRKVIIDSKVSLIAWDQYAAASTVQEQKTALDNHVKSIKSHIDGLSKKDYPKYAKALDHVIMFIPIEPAFLEAVKHDITLWKYAYDKMVLLVGPTNLLLVLKIVADMWQIDKQSKNAVAIAEKAGELYDKLYSFVESMEELGLGLKKANDNYVKAMGQLSQGKGNAIKKAEELKALGAEAKKQFPDRLIDNNDSIK